ncbi:MAG: AAA family ATPase [Phycisphaerales bacterium]|nr:AAA family ATPase [Phycisphaerales bacterium]
MNTIKKLILSNFKRFKYLELDFDDGMNILIGDNESGKSSVLLAIDLVLSGSKGKVETIGIETIFNREVVASFLAGDKSLATLPTMFVEVYLSEQHNPDLNGKNNSKSIIHDGLRFESVLHDDFSKDAVEILKDPSCNFPFEYYESKFVSFAGQVFSGFRRPMKHVIVDSSQINSDYATREYTKSLYDANSTPNERSKSEYLYRTNKEKFRIDTLAEINQKLDSYQFGVRSSSKSNLATDIIVLEKEMPIESKGKGRQCFIKTDFALHKAQSLNAILLEEPENHLSHTNMKKLLERIADSNGKQLFIATHSSLICTRLDLRKAILMNSSGEKPASLKELPKDTARFFIKAPDNNVLEFVLSNKVILVEGDAEFILMDAFYRKESEGSSPEKDGVHVIAVGGTSFKRYLDLAKMLSIKTAVVCDNDGNYQNNCIAPYTEHESERIGIFSDKNSARRTFEICLYKDNKAACDELFQPSRVKLSVEEYMLKNKTDAAFELLDKKAASLVTPEYIKEAIAWIRK